MDITNKISRDSAYPNNESLENRNRENIPEIRQDSYFKKELSRINNIDKTNTLDKKEKILESIDKVNKRLQVFDRKLEISVHEKTREVMVKVIDTTTDEIIRELPPEKVLDNLASRRELIGLLMNKKI